MSERVEYQLGIRNFKIRAYLWISLITYITAALIIRKFFPTLQWTSLCLVIFHQGPNLWHHVPSLIKLDLHCWCDQYRVWAVATPKLSSPGPLAAFMWGQLVISSPPKSSSIFMDSSWQANGPWSPGKGCKIGLWTPGIWG